MKLQHLLLLAFIACTTKGAAQQAAMASTNIRQFLDDAEKNLGFHGTVLLVQNGDTLVYKGYGYSDIKKKVPTDKSIAYNTASVTKGITAVAVLKLVEEGKLNLQAPLTKYLENVPESKAAITLHHLLSHTSGIGQNYAAEGEEDRRKAAQKILKLPLADSVGKRFIYSNDNYMLLAIIIEQVTGGTWEAYIRHTILTPLGMNETFFQNEYGEVMNLRVPKMDGKRPGAQKRDYGMVGSTGIFSTVVDLAKFQRALSTTTILTNQSKDLLLGKYIKIGSPWAATTSYYGYAFFVTETTTIPLEKVWLRGNEEAWGTSITFWLPQMATTLVVLSNRLDLSNGEKPHIHIANEIFKRLPN